MEHDSNFRALSVVFGDGYHEAVRGVGVRIEGGVPMYARVSRRALLLYREAGVLQRLNRMITNASLEWGGHWYPDDVQTWQRRRLNVVQSPSEPSQNEYPVICA